MYLSIETVKKKKEKKNRIRIGGLKSVLSMSAIDLLREDITRQEQLVQSLRARQSERQHLLQHMRRALEAGASVERSDEVAAATVRLQEALEGLSFQNSVDNETSAFGSGTLLPAFDNRSPNHTVNGLPSPIPPEGLTEEDGSLTPTHMEAVVERQLNMDDLLGINEPATEEEYERQQRRRMKKAHRRLEKKKRVTHADPNEENTTLSSPVGFENRKTKERLRQLREEEEKQRALLFAALDRLIPVSLPSDDMMNTSQIAADTRIEDLGGRTPPCPLWLREEESEVEERDSSHRPDDVASQASSSTTASSHSSFSSSPHHSRSDSSSSERGGCLDIVNGDAEKKGGSPSISVGQEDNVIRDDETYSSDFEDVQSIGDD